MGNASYSEEDRLALAIERGILFDPEDEWIIRERSWQVSHNGYARTQYLLSDGTKENWMLHMRILGVPPEGMVIDHINRNKLDNRRCNLRIISQSDNCKNSSRASLGSVRYIRRGDYYKAAINVGSFQEDFECQKEIDLILSILREANYLFPHERRFAQLEKERKGGD